MEPNLKVENGGCLTDPSVTQNTDEGMEQDDITCILNDIKNNDENMQDETNEDEEMVHEETITKSPVDCNKTITEVINNNERVPNISSSPVVNDDIHNLSSIPNNVQENTFNCILTSNMKIEDEDELMLEEDNCVGETIAINSEHKEITINECYTEQNNSSVNNLQTQETCTIVEHGSDNFINSECASNTVNSDVSNSEDVVAVNSINNNSDQQVLNETNKATIILDMLTQDKCDLYQSSDDIEQLNNKQIDNVEMNDDFDCKSSNSNLLISEDSQSKNLEPVAIIPPTGKKRGRKRKVPLVETTQIHEAIDTRVPDIPNTSEQFLGDIITASETESEKDTSGVVAKPRRRGRAKKNPDIIPSHLTSDDLILAYKILLKFYETPQFTDFHKPFELNMCEEIPDNKITCLNQIKQKFDDNNYKGITEFINDVREMLFIVYESKNTIATKRALRLEQLLDQRIAQLPKDLRQKCAQEFTSDESNSNCKKNRMNKGGGYVSLLLEKAERSRSEKDKEKRRLQAEERKQLKEEQDKDIQEWERSVLLGSLEQDIKSMWELPQIGLFVHLCRELLNIGEISQYEVERMLLMPQCSGTLDLLVTALLSNSLVRAKLDRTPAMPYTIWGPLLRTRVSAWYRAWHRESKNGVKLFEEVGIEPQFWEVLGPEVNLLDHFYFHEITLHQRVWVLKTLCDVDFVRKKTVYDNIRAQPLDELNGIDLGMDRHGNRYIHFKQFCGPDLRIYRQKMELGDDMEAFDLIENFEGFEAREGPITTDKIFKDIWDIGDKFDKLNPPVRRRRTNKKKRITRVNMKEDDVVPKKNLRISARNKQKVYVDYSDSDQSDTDLQTLKKKLSQPGGKETTLYKPFSDKEFISLNVFRLPRDKTPKQQPKKSGYIKKCDLAHNVVEIKENPSDAGTDISNTDSNSKTIRCEFSKVKDETEKSSSNSKCLGFDEEALDSLDLKPDDTQILDFDKSFPNKEDMDDEYFDFDDKISSFKLNHKQNFTVQNLENLKMVFKKGDQNLDKDQVSNDSSLLHNTDKTEVKTDPDLIITYDVPSQMQPNSDNFYLVVDSIDSLKQLISKFSSDENDLEIISRSTRKTMKQPKLKTPSCEVRLIERLQNLLSELEPWEIDFLKSSRNSRDKLYKEYISFTNRPDDYIHPNEGYWMKMYEEPPPPSAATTSTSSVTTIDMTQITTTLSGSSNVVKTDTGVQPSTSSDSHYDMPGSSSSSTVYPSVSCDLGLRKRKRVTRIQLKPEKDDDEEDEDEEDTTLESSESDDNWEMPSAKKRPKKESTPKLIKEKPKRLSVKRKNNTADGSCQVQVDKSTQSSPQDKQNKTLFWGSRSCNPVEDLDWERNRQKILEKHNSSGAKPSKTAKRVLFKGNDIEEDMELLENALKTKRGPLITVATPVTSTQTRYFPVIPGNKKPYYSTAQLKAMEKKPTSQIKCVSGTAGREETLVRSIQPIAHPTLPRGVAQTQTRPPVMVQKFRQMRPIVKTTTSTSTQSMESSHNISFEQPQQQTQQQQQQSDADDMFITDGNVLVKADDQFITQFMQGDTLFTVNLNQSSLDTKKTLFIVKRTPTNSSSLVEGVTREQQDVSFTEMSDKLMKTTDDVAVQKQNNIFYQQQAGKTTQATVQVQRQVQIPATSASVIAHTNIPLPSFRNLTRDRDVIQQQQPVTSSEQLDITNVSDTINVSSNYVLPSINNTYTLLTTNQDNRPVESYTLMQTDQMSLDQTDQNYTLIQSSDGNQTLTLVQQKPTTPSELGVQQQILRIVAPNTLSQDLLLTSTPLRFTTPTQTNTVRTVGQPVLLKTNVGRAMNQSAGIRISQTQEQNKNISAVIRHTQPQQKPAPVAASNLRFIRPQNMATTYRNIPLSNVAVSDGRFVTTVVTSPQSVTTRPSLVPYQNTQQQPRPVTPVKMVQSPTGVRMFTTSPNGQLREVHGNFIPPTQTPPNLNIMAVPRGAMLAPVQTRMISPTQITQNTTVPRMIMSAPQLQTIVPRAITGQQPRMLTSLQQPTTTVSRQQTPGTVLQPRLVVAAAAPTPTSSMFMPGRSVPVPRSIVTTANIQSPQQTLHPRIISGNTVNGASGTVQRQMMSPRMIQAQVRSVQQQQTILTLDEVQSTSIQQLPVKVVQSPTQQLRPPALTTTYNQIRLVVPNQVPEFRMQTPVTSATVSLTTNPSGPRFLTRNQAPRTRPPFPPRQTVPGMRMVSPFTQTRAVTATTDPAPRPASVVRTTAPPAAVVNQQIRPQRMPTADPTAITNQPPRFPRVLQRPGIPTSVRLTVPRAPSSADVNTYPGKNNRTVQQQQQVRPTNQVSVVNTVRVNTPISSGTTAANNTPRPMKVPVLTQATPGGPIVIRIEEDDDIKIIDDNFEGQQLRIVSSQDSGVSYEFDDGQQSDWQSTASDSTQFFTDPELDH